MNSEELSTTPQRNLHKVHSEVMYACVWGCPNDKFPLRKFFFFQKVNNKRAQSVEKLTYFLALLIGGSVEKLTYFHFLLLERVFKN